MEEHEYIKLFEKHLSGKTTAEEEQLIKDHRDEFELLDLPWDSMSMGDQAKIKARLQTDLKTHMEPVPKKYITHRFWYAAAALLLVSSFAVYFSVDFGRFEKPIAQVIESSTKTISPGASKAILTLSDGGQVSLDEDGTERTIQEGDAIISNKKAGLLVYNGLESGEKEVANTYNTLSVPRGGKYDVILSDGTKVWLNAASSLRFPTTFSGSERKVFVTGEAYFEVAKNADMPFRVEANGTAVRVLGTHFNIMAYEDEEVITTTLLEGSVEILNNSAKSVLKPGYQASVQKSSGQISIGRVNTAQFVAWKEGQFVFNDDGIEAIMRKLSRWYDIEVSYNKGNLSDKYFTGTISRYESISEVLSMLELTGTIQFKISGRRITVMP